MSRNTSGITPNQQPSLQSGQELGANQPNIEDRTLKAKPGPQKQSADSSVNIIRTVEPTKNINIEQAKREPTKTQPSDIDASERQYTENDQNSKQNQQLSDETLGKTISQDDRSWKTCQKLNIGEVHISRAEKIYELSEAKKEKASATVYLSVLEKERANTYDAFATPPDIVKAKEHRVDCHDIGRFQAHDRPAVTVYGGWLE